MISIKIRWKEECTPFMNKHMNINVWLHNYVARLPRTRKNMMFKIRKRFAYHMIKE